MTGTEAGSSGTIGAVISMKDKTLLVGEHKSLGKRRWARADLVYRDKIVGTVLRTRAGVKPIYVSPGLRMGMDGAVELARRCTDRYRIPEPTRQAR